MGVIVVVMGATMAGMRMSDRITSDRLELKILLNHVGAEEMGSGRQVGGVRIFRLWFVVECRHGFTIEDDER